MTDLEQTEILARLTGWTVGRDHHGEYWADAKGDWVAAIDDTPFHARDDCCMAAWDKFTRMVRIANVSWTGGAWVVTCNNEDIRTCDKDRRRAMCECMAKAVQP